ncbi:MAG: FKBP-type peptidyl-prolyl cis-trans isomerase [Exilibacterium sp.]
MKPYVIIGLMTSVLLAAGCNQKEQTPASEASAKEPELNTLEQKVSYLFGFDIGRRFKSDDMELDITALTLALEDAKSGAEPRLSQEEIQVVMKTFQEKQQAKRAEAHKVVAEANKKEGEEFLAANAKKEGVVTTESGLQYKVLKEGTGPKPTEDSKVSVHYRGTLINGTEFDSSYRHDKPVSFPVKGVIAGWTEALQLMKEGAKWELYIPSDLAYGPGGTGSQIGPNSTLIFEVELLKANVE